MTGGAGFIGSHLVESLLGSGWQVKCLDNLSTGSLKNIKHLLDHENLVFIEGDILDFDLVSKLAEGVDYISHQAALGSVPRSIHDPILSNRVNVEGTLNVFKAAVDNQVNKVVYAASSSTYGDAAGLPKKEEKIGKPLSPYAVTKLVNELYADVFHRTYGLNTIGLRYFNVFGPRQNPNGAYAAVIPLFIKSMLNGSSPSINGDGNHSRDFTFVVNAVQANRLALETTPENDNQVYNIACGEQTSLNDLVNELNEILGKEVQPEHRKEREGDVKHSLADISKARGGLGYNPEYDVKTGLKKTIEWFKTKT